MVDRRRLRGAGAQGRRMVDDGLGRPLFGRAGIDRQRHSLGRGVLGDPRQLHAGRRRSSARPPQGGIFLRCSGGGPDRGCGADDLRRRVGCAADAARHGATVGRHGGQRARFPRQCHLGDDPDTRRPRGKVPGARRRRSSHHDGRGDIRRRDRRSHRGGGHRFRYPRSAARDPRRRQHPLSGLAGHFLR